MLDRWPREIWDDRIRPAAVWVLVSVVGRPVGMRPSGGEAVSVLGGPYEVVEDAVPMRPVQRARWAAQWASNASDAVALVVDADRDELVRVPGLPAHRWALQGLAGDGAGLVL